MSRKSRAGRRSGPLVADVLEALQGQRHRQSFERRAAGDRWQDTGLIFTTPVGGPLDGGNLLKQYRAHLERAVLPAFRFHDLRHSAASLMLAQGISPHEIQGVLGHSDLSTTADIYMHLYPASLKRAAAAMDAILGGEPAADSTAVRALI